jgi:N-formylglutamate amidohydrolase
MELMQAVKAASADIREIPKPNIDSQVLVDEMQNKIQSIVKKYHEKLDEEMELNEFATIVLMDMRHNFVGGAIV